MDAIFKYLDPYRWLIAVALLASVLGYHFYAVNAAEKRGFAAGDIAGAARVQTAFDSYRGDMINQTSKLLKDAYLATAALRDSFTKRQKEFDDEQTAIARQHARDVDSLRVRATRAELRAERNRRLADTARADPPAEVCTGAQLPREDAEFLTGEATQATLTQSWLKKCVADLDDAQRAIAEFNAKHQGPPDGSPEDQ